MCKIKQPTDTQYEALWGLAEIEMPVRPPHEGPGRQQYTHL